jgi:hypothetical protein
MQPSCFKYQSQEVTWNAHWIDPAQLPTQRDVEHGQCRSMWRKSYLGNQMASSAVVLIGLDANYRVLPHSRCTRPASFVRSTSTPLQVRIVAQESIEDAPTVVLMAPSSPSSAAFIYTRANCRQVRQLRIVVSLAQRATFLVGHATLR